MKRNDNLSAERLREVLDYDENSGKFRWKKRLNNTFRVGDLAGGPSAAGYWRIRIDRVMYFAHRLAWLWVNGVWPDEEIDHINGNRSDNRLANLRHVSRQVNTQNQRCAMPSSKTKLLGTSPKNSRYMASIGVDGKTRYLGMHDTPEEAHEAYLQAKRKLHAGCTI